MYQDCLTEGSVPKESTVTSCMCFATLAMNSGRLTGTSTCHQTATAGEVAEMGVSRSGTAIIPGDSVTAAEVQHDQTDHTVDVRKAGVERGGCPTRTRRTNGGRDTVTEGTPDICTEETELGVEVETEKKIEEEREVEKRTESASPGTEVKTETKMETHG